MKVYKNIIGHAKESFKKFINNSFLKNFDIIFIKNEKSYQNIKLFFFIKTFFK